MLATYYQAAVVAAAGLSGIIIAAPWVPVLWRIVTAAGAAFYGAVYLLAVSVAAGWSSHYDGLTFFDHAAAAFLFAFAATETACRAPDRRVYLKAGLIFAAGWVVAVAIKHGPPGSFLLVRGVVLLAAIAAGYGVGRWWPAIIPALIRCRRAFGGR